jgi:glycosyltransferase involved in cell wall biosynthesis
MKATLIVPTLNEREGIGFTLQEFRRATEEANRTLFLPDPVDWEILVVDGGSTDGTPEIAREHGARVILEPRRGYGRAYRTGFSQATGDFIATMDGDGTYPAPEVPWLLLHLLYHHKDFVTADRLTYLERRAMTTEHRLGNRVLNFFLRVLFHQVLQDAPARVLVDSQSGMWVFRREILDRLQLGEDGMAFSEEIKLEVLLRGFRLDEIPVHYAERWGRPKISSWRDGLKNLTWLLRKRVRVSREVRRGAPVLLSGKAPNLPRGEG